MNPTQLTQLILIRHGETAWNAVRRLQGHTDIALNDEGLRQAAALAQALAEEPLTLLVSSDLQRAQQTAAALAERRAALTVHTDSALRERCFGVFEGMLYTDIAQQYPADYARWQARESDAVMPSGPRTAESFRQFYQRSTEAIGAWARRYPGHTIAMVAHGGVLECAYRAALGLPLDRPRDFQVRNASINRFLWANDQLTLTSWGEVDHLRLAALDDIV